MALDVKAPGFERPHLQRYMREWAADQREREAWKDGDRSTYRFRADVLEHALALLDRLERAEAVCVAAADCGGTGGVVHRWDAGDSALQRLSVAVARWREVAKP